MHIRPEAYKKDIQESTAIASTDFLGDIEDKLGRKLSPTEQLTLTTDLDAPVDYDTIERI